MHLQLGQLANRTSDGMTTKLGSVQQNHESILVHCSIINLQQTPIKHEAVVTGYNTIKHCGKTAKTVLADLWQLFQLEKLKRNHAVLLHAMFSAA